MQEIDSADVGGMRDTSSKELLDEIQIKRKRIRFAPVVGVISLVGSLWSYGRLGETWILVASLLITLFLTVYLAYKDQLRKTVVLFYDLEPDYEQAYRRLHDAFEDLRRSRIVWHVDAEAEVRDWKRTGGATGAIRKRRINPRFALPAFFRANVPVPSIPVGRQTLHFLPERVLVIQGSKAGAISYSALLVERQPQRFIEDGTVPRDAQVVDSTWQYVNKKGGPDRRFKDNRELPIALYDDVHFRSDTGLNERIELSLTEGATAFVEAIEGLTELAAASPEVNA